MDNVGRMREKEMVMETNEKVLKVRHDEAGSHVFTDTLRSHNGLAKDFVHKAVDHAREYVRGNVHTNGMENF